MAKYTIKIIKDGSLKQTKTCKLFSLVHFPILLLYAIPPNNALGLGTYQLSNSLIKQGHCILMSFKILKMFKLLRGVL